MFITGAEMIRKLSVALGLVAMLASPAAAGIGRVKTSLGTAVVQRGTERLVATTGQELLAGDWLETGNDGRISLTFADETRFSVGPDSRIGLSEFKYDPTTQKGSFIASVERGTIAVVTGRISKSGRDAMQFKTPDAVVGTRGTRFIIEVR